MDSIIKSTFNYKEIEKNLGLSFKNKAILLTAFVHRSFLNENKEEKLESNERLEFLGDAILQFLTSEYIYKTKPDFPEGRLTNLRALLVNTESLADETTRLDLAQYILVSKGEKQTAIESNHMKANLFEAILGAIYLDSDIEKCRSFLTNNLFYKADELVEKGSLKDPKSLYQEYAQEKYLITPSYKVLEDSGPDHNKSFVVGVYLDNKKVAQGEGSSKQKAQKEAALNALRSEGYDMTKAE